MAGAFKFNPQHTQVLPAHLLQHFRSYINNICTLVCIGYAFADDHINKIIREWLEFSQTRRIEIVSPNVDCVPRSFLHIASQIDLYTSNATDYLDEYAGIVRSTHEVNHKKFVSLIRENEKAVISEVLKFSRERQVDNLVEIFRSLRLRHGDIDEVALGVPLDDFIHEEVRRISTPVEIIDAFVNSRAGTR